jgi:L-ribulose-5-phosphate 4-epimerase
MSDRERIARLREAVYRANIDLVDKGLVIDTFGNVSGIDRDMGMVAIKPSGVSYDRLSAETMVLLDMDGKRIEGDLNPSSDTKTHLHLYHAFPGIGGVVHTHSRMATSWAQAKRPLPCLGTTHADYFHGEIPCTAVITDEQILRDYEEETGVQIVEAFTSIDYRSMPGVLVASHGPFTWGRDAADAVHNSVILEYVAEMAAAAFALNPSLTAVRQTLLDKHYLRKHGKGAYYGQGGGKAPA